MSLKFLTTVAKHFAKTCLAFYLMHQQLILQYFLNNEKIMYKESMFLSTIQSWKQILEQAVVILYLVSKEANHGFFSGKSNVHYHS